MSYEGKYLEKLSKLKPQLAISIESAIASCEFEVEPDFSFKEKYDLLCSLEHDCLANDDIDTFSDNNVERHESLLREPTKLEEVRFIQYLEAGGDITSASVSKYFKT